ncbi:MAG TPA: ABC transporter permease [Candidatus Acutalibacter pullistercoris]|uniref:ABC transporter permease n=1 Tax=Candidatus Acutalibacter pullistercoris TaxID=2838418 RepID=A0A9D2C0S8_9FIRM|nr:ABC transporter permease [Candidatus Acutalibacter pullistercoris]
MFKYVLKRLAYSIVTLFVLVALTFFLQHMLPGDPFIGDKALPDATMEALRAKYGLDKSLPEQFLIYLGNCLRGDLGLSIQNNRPVTTIIYESFLVSFDLGIRAIIFALILGVFLGTVAAIKRGKAIDTVCMFIALVGVSVPSFIMASLLQYFLGLQLTTALKGAGMSAMFAATGWEAPNSKILPVLALGFGSLAQISRLTRTSMLDVLGQDYIKTARAKGLSQGAIIWRHALRNAIMPVVTVLGPITAGVLTGAFVVENIFAVPGLGKYFVQSIQVLDYTMISGTTIFYGAFLILANLVVDLVYGIIDPRVKLEEG